MTCPPTVRAASSGATHTRQEPAGPGWWIRRGASGTVRLTVSLLFDTEEVLVVDVTVDDDQDPFAQSLRSWGHRPASRPSDVEDRDAVEGDVAFLVIDEDLGVVSGKVRPAGADEFTCRVCFLLHHRSQERDGVCADCA